MEPPRGVASSRKPSAVPVLGSHPHAGRADPAPWHPHAPRGAGSGSRRPRVQPQAYLLADLTHGEVLVVTRACHTDVLEPAAGPGLIRVHTELLAAQLFRDLPRKKEHRAGSGASSLQDPGCLGSGWQAVRHLDVSAPSGQRRGAWPTRPARPGAAGSSVRGRGPSPSSPSDHWPRTRGATSVANAPQQSCPTCEKAEATVSQNEPSAEGSWGAGMEKTVLEGKGVGACGCPRAWA